MVYGAQYNISINMGKKIEDFFRDIQEKQSFIWLYSLKTFHRNTGEEIDFSGIFRKK